MDEALRRKDDEMVEDLEKRFDRHLEIYANNGKEMARLAAAVERMEERANVRDEKVNEMFEVYQQFKFGKKGIFWLIGTLTFLGGAFLTAKQIMK